MTSYAAAFRNVRARAVESTTSVWAPVCVGGLAFLLLFWSPMVTLVRDWLSNPDASHGLLLAPVAVYLAWKRGMAPEARGQPIVGLALLAGAVLLRYMAGLAAEMFTLRFSMFTAAAAIVVFAYGVRQLIHWWLPVALLVLSIPLPQVLLNTLALPLQFQASAFGAAMLESRHVPVLLAGNVIHLPGQSLFVTEACSGLRSLTALVALGLLIGGIWLQSPWSRGALLLAAIPVAMAVNGFRIFLTGFLVYFVDPGLGEGVMHYTEGWALFVVAFLILGVATWALRGIEHWLGSRRRS